MASQVGRLLHLALVAIAFLFLCSSHLSPAPAFAMSSPPSELDIQNISLPANAASLPKAKKGDAISVHYVRLLIILPYPNLIHSSSILSALQTGTFFANGEKFDSSVDRGKPFDVTLGVGQVIKGWDEGLLGMVKGEKRKLTIPPHKAYGTYYLPHNDYHIVYLY